MTTKIEASVAMLKVIESWGVNHIYGYPGGSINSTMKALEEEQENLQYIQVRHEQVGALAAAADAKLTGKIGVCFGSAGPGAVNLLNGLYDAREDKAPVLAIVGQVPHTRMNYDFFQEFNEAPIFDDVSVYNRTIMTPESLPYIIDKAIRMAYKENGVAVVVIPNDFGYVEIPDSKYSTEKTRNQAPILPSPDPELVSEAWDMLKNAKYPVIHLGQGARGATEVYEEISEKLQIPIVITGLAKGVIPDDFEGNMGPFYRASSKVSDELIKKADVLLSIGADFPFAGAVFSDRPLKYIQVDIDQAKFGRHHSLDLGIWSDAKLFGQKLLEVSDLVEARPFYKAALEAQKDWRAYLQKMMDRTEEPLEYEQVYKEINRIADDDAVFSLDVGDNTINSFRFLDMNPKQKILTSALFATRGCGIPGAMAASLSYPGRQAFNIAGDGAFSMVMQDIITEKRYNLPIINIVTSNRHLSFIRSEQDDVPQNEFGVDLTDADYAKIAEGMGIKGIKVDKFSDLHKAFDEAVTEYKAGRPVLIDCNITDKRGIPVELDLNTDGSIYEDPKFLATYDASELKPFDEYLAEYSAD
ncbi:pyruvate oxidase [Pediococcus claussenii]|uniref:Pyruvate oxidase n=1 Tax=Pediococcus claussenii (strain ATCC BAA-344 / DSM 14800 / JCM 18046 / KCTC 3811 / LMG 21948 / P06) TaxID=701521 RepID=G8PCP0_PEDCP|nr:pyruvate oxidase [Pediococcus claussenii]AEV95025.1 pyruvate oxidase [Pediococcus claussenii ATCC BAA-344]ANZ70214.1 pyruvate oxidase [Pediococcus claussenii]ANZ72030.1 pyruvate oxidase [Pediococcus claussenii]KRN19173.1 spxB protein [Pediococcus claussenii]